MKDFEPITAALAPYMEKYAHGKKSWAFWSGKPAVEVAKKHAEVCLEKSALGSLFDGININGSWDIQLWASLSKAYASHAAQHIGEAQYSGFVGMGSSADQSIFNKIEQPQFVSMLDEKAKSSLHVAWYAVAGDPKQDMKVPDWRFHAGAFDGVYGTGDRAAMVALAEGENKRRMDLWTKDKVDEGPGGSTGGPADPVKLPVDMAGAAHTITVTPGPSPKVEMASTPGLVKTKVATALTNLRAQKPAPADLGARVTALEGITKQAEQLETLLATPGTGRPAIETAVKGLAASIRNYGATYNAKDIEDALADALLTPEQRTQLESVCANFAAQIKRKGEKARFLADPKLYIEGDRATRTNPRLTSGDLVEGVGSDKVTAHAAGATVWRNAHLQFVDGSGADVGGSQAELDFLILGKGSVTEIVSAKINTEYVKPSQDRGHLSKFYLSDLAHLPTDPTELAKVTSKFGDARAYRSATEVVIRYQDETGVVKIIPLAQFQANYPPSTTAVGVRGLVPQSEPGEKPPHPDSLTLDITRSDLIEIAIIEIKKRL